MILDTTALVDVERGVAGLDELIADEDDVSIAAITAAELLVGVELADPVRRPPRARFVEALLGAISVEDYDLSVARAHAAILAEARRDGRPRGAHDLMVAATARARERVVISSDRDGFAGLSGVAVRAPRGGGTSA